MIIQSCHLQGIGEGDGALRATEILVTLRTSPGKYFLQSERRDGNNPASGCRHLQLPRRTRGINKIKARANAAQISIRPVYLAKTDRVIIYPSSKEPTAAPAAYSPDLIYFKYSGTNYAERSKRKLFHRQYIFLCNSQHNEWFPSWKTKKSPAAYPIKGCRPRFQEQKLRTGQTGSDASRSSSRAIMCSYNS